jgi:hypothetical protein
MLPLYTRTRIAHLYNSIMVAEYMQRETDTVTGADLIDYLTRWQERANHAAIELYTLYGIEPVGYSKLFKAAA